MLRWSVGVFLVFLVCLGVSPALARPGSPQDVHVRPVSDTELRVAWDLGPPGVEYRVVELGEGRSSEWFTPDSQYPIAYYDFDDLAPSRQYGFTVFARDGSGTSYSAFALGTTMVIAPGGHGMEGNDHGLYGARYTVTTGADSGFGSLRSALYAPEPLYIDFAVSDVFLTSDQLRVTTQHKTVDGTSAPGGAVTIHADGGENAMSFENVRDGGPGEAAAYIFVRGVYVQGGDRDGFAIGGRDINLGDESTENDAGDPAYASHHIVLFECSSFDNLDGNIDVGSGASDWTVQRCVMGNVEFDRPGVSGWSNQKNMLIGSGPTDVIRRGSMLENLIIRADSRAPLVQGDVDDVVVANNVLFAAMGYGWRVQCHCESASDAVPCEADDPCPSLRTRPTIINNYVVPLPLRYGSSSGLVTQSALKKKVHTVNWLQRDGTRYVAHMSGNAAHNGALEPLHTRGEPSPIPAGFRLRAASSLLAIDLGIHAGSALRSAAEEAKRDSLLTEVVSRPVLERDPPTAVPGSVHFAAVEPTRVVLSVADAVDVDRGHGFTPSEDMEYSAVWYPVDSPADIDSMGFFADTRLEVEGLEPETWYSIAVRAWDQWHNPSPLSRTSRFYTPSDIDSWESRSTADAAVSEPEPVVTPPLVSIRPSPGRGPFRIAWTVDDAAPASLHVVDAAGRHVWTKRTFAQNGSATWSGRDERGRRAGAGVYWLVVRQHGSAVAVNRFVVVA